MAKKPIAAAGRTASTPREIQPTPVHVIDGIATAGALGGAIALTLVTNLVSSEDGHASDDFVVAARLRMSVHVARALRQALDDQIAALTAPHGPAN